jgi:hypothetical protein
MVIKCDETLHLIFYIVTLTVKIKVGYYCTVCAYISLCAGH